MNTKIKLLSLIMTIVLVFSGCSFNQNTKISDAGDCKNTVAFTFERSYFDQLKGYLAMMPGDIQVDKMSDEEILKALFSSQDMQDTGVNLKNSDVKVESFTENDIDYIKLIINQSSKLTEENKYIESDSPLTNLQYLTKDTLYTEIDFGDMNELEPAILEQIGNIPFEFTVEFPQKIVNKSNNVTVDSSEPNVAKYSFAINKINSPKLIVFATTKNGVTIESVKKEIKKLKTLKTPKIKKIKSKKKGKKKSSVTVTVSKSKEKNVKYTLKYSTSKKFKKAKTANSNKNKITIKNLTNKKKYYFKAMISADKKYYVANSTYSKAKKFTVKGKKSKKSKKSKKK